MRGRSVVGSSLLLFVALASTAACEPKKETPDSSAPSTVAPPVASAPTRVDPDPPKGPKAPACRIVSGEGGPGPKSDPTTWLDAPAKATFAVHMTETGREVRFEGPTHVRACSPDVSLLASGIALGLSGAGDGPGSESWVAFPCGVARWTAGVTKVLADECKVQVSTGTAFVWPPQADAGMREGWQAVEARTSASLGKPVPPEKAVADCEAAGREIARLAKAMTDAGPALGTFAADAVTARRNGRAACALATLRANGNPDLEKRAAAASNN